jgi:hypothetical protein
MALSEDGLAASPFHFIIMFPIRWLFGAGHLSLSEPGANRCRLRLAAHHPCLFPKKGIALSIAPKTWLLLSSSIH